MKIKKILIANRGEIALRVIRSAKDMGIITVAVFSEEDRRSPHVRMADEAAYIGKAPSSDSYLNMKKIIDVCKKFKADAIHPGYGFLSENASFVQTVEEEGIIFIGPSAQSIRIMGDKLSAKSAASSYNIPMVPGMETAITNIEEAKKYALEIGYPILIKASAGGGGKGIRMVKNAEDFETQLERAISEAGSSFGNRDVFLEKFITSPKHIEIQILADKHGNIVHLFERDCSVQRRNQKIVEEAPSVILTESLRRKIGEHAVEVAKSCNYYGAGTVEFMLDKDKNFYFLEMNTRLQVEHPVTEMITGVDFVKEMIKISEGKTLSFTQQDLEIRGHAIELRISAEDPNNNFLPDIGKLKTYRPPRGPGIRIDDGYEEGMNISIYYDPMIAKLISYGNDRKEAIIRMIRAIDEYQITGIKTTLEFGKFVLQHPEFLNDNFDTGFVEKYFKPTSLQEEIKEEEMKIAAIVIGNLLSENNQKNQFKIPERKRRSWKDTTKSN